MGLRKTLKVMVGLKYIFPDRKYFLSGPQMQLSLVSKLWIGGTKLIEENFLKIMGPLYLED